MEAVGPEHAKVAQTMNNLAAVLGEQGKYEEAKRMQGHALAIWEKTLGIEHPELTWALSELGELYRKKKEFAMAKINFKRALAICEKAMCDPEPEAIAKFGIARILWKAGKKKHQAIQLAKQARDGFNKRHVEKSISQIDKWLKERGVTPQPLD